MSFLLLLPFVGQQAVAQLKFIEGQDYAVLANPLPLQKTGEKEVVEFFSYACPHCYNLNESVIEWEKTQKPEGVTLYQIPAFASSQWNFVARVKMVADKVGLGHDFDQQFFNAIHKEGNRALLRSKDDVVDFMVSQGANVSDVEKAWDSLQVKRKEKQAKEQWSQTGFTGVPAFLVNGKYAVTLSTPERLFAVVNFLLETTSVE